MNEEATVKFLIDEEHAGLRADGVLSQLFEEASRSYVQKLIAGGHVFCDGSPLLVAAIPAVGFNVVFVRFDRDEKDFAARRLMVRFAVVFDEKEAGEHITVLQFQGGNVPQGVVVPCGLMRRSVRVAGRNHPKRTRPAGRCRRNGF